MGHRSRHSGPSIRTLLGDHLGVAAEAVVCGSVHEGHWETLAAFVARDGVDSVAQALARQEGFAGPSREWWRCMLLLHSSLSRDDALRVTRELIAIEEAGGGPAFDIDRHAVQVSGAVRWLQAHLTRVLGGAAGREEMESVARVVKAVRVERVGGGFP